MTVALRATTASVALATLLMTPGLVAPRASAAVIPVVTTADGGFGSLRQAFETANTNGQPDEILLAEGATYQLTNCGPAGQEDANADGDLDHTAADAVTLRGSGATIENSCLDERVLHLLGAGPVTLIDVTLTGGNSPNDGAGILSEATSLSLLRSAVVANTSGDDAGGIYTQSPVRIEDSVISNNTAASRGGGLYTTMADVTVIGSTFSGNRALTSDGGAIRNTSGINILIDSTFSGNSSDSEGGALRSGEGNVTVENSTLSGNTAGLNGGAIRVATGTLSLNNVTVTGNSAPSGQGGGIQNLTGTTILANSIVAANTGGDCETSGGIQTSDGSNIDGDGSCGLTGPGDKPSTDPKLGPLANNGGPTQTHMLLKGSPALNGAAPASAPTADQRGAPRKDPDIGAYELVYCAKVLVNRIGMNGKDKLKGTNGPDGMLGLGGKDILTGKGGKDGLCGGSGKDTLKGGGGKDRLQGQGGKDVCVGGPAADKAVCEEERSI